MAHRITLYESKRRKAEREARGERLESSVERGKAVVSLVVLAAIAFGLYQFGAL